MSFIAIETVNDEGAAQVAREALGAAGIPVELRRLGGNPYLGSKVEIEVRVPQERLDEAEGVLAEVGLEAEEAAAREALAYESPGEMTQKPPHGLEKLWLVFLFGTVLVGLLLWVLA